jgi:deferrochelatase/peroxidase EfeB
MRRLGGGPSRRGLFATAGGILAAVGTGFGARAAPGEAVVKPQNDHEPFWGTHQAGILTPAQSHTYFAAFDLTTTKRDDVASLLRLWTDAAALLTRGQPIAPVTLDQAYGDDPTTLARDSGDTFELPAARLTLTFGFGAGLFVKDSQDRYGLAGKRPPAFVDLPKFNGDQLIPALTGGDLSVQACADDPQVAFHAIRQLAQIGFGVAELRWAQTGFLSRPANGTTPRNLMGFKDGTQVPQSVEKAVWVNEGPAWMQGGSYLVVRRIRIALEHWDRTKIDFQEQTVGRHKHSGAPLGLKDEFEPLGLERTDADENPVIAEHAHVRMANAANIGAAEILRRGYAYNDGANFVAERWPPWQQAMEYDAGLLFICYQNDPRTGFIKTFEDMAKFDMLNQFTTHTGGGLFACPGGALEGTFIGARLFDAA